MRIQSRLVVSIVASVMVSAVIASIAFFILRGMKIELERSRVYDEVITKSNALNVLLAALKQDPSPSDLRQILSVNTSLDDLLNKVSSSDAIEQSLIRQIRKNNERLGVLLDQIPASGVGSGALEKERKEILDSQLWMKVRQISDGIYRLRGMSRSRIVSAQTNAGITVFLLLITLIFSNTLISVLSGRKIVQSEETLRESEEKFSKLFHSNPQWVHISTLEDGRYVEVNEATKGITGYKRDELIGRTSTELGLWADYEERSRLVKIAKEQGGFRNQEMTFIKKHGESVSLLSSATTIEIKGTAYLINSIADITERKQAEKELTRLRLYLKNMFDSMPSVLVGVNESGLVTQWNKETERLTGISADNAKGQPLSRVLPQLKHQMEQIKTAISRKEPQIEQKVSKQEDGETRYSDIMVYPLIANGVEGAVIRVDDVTDRVRIEQMMIQTEKMMSVGGLAAGMAHEINNPLGAILQGVQNAIRRVSPDLEANRKAAEECGADLEAVRRYLEKRGIIKYFDGMREAGSRAAKIVSNMLNFSRISESRLAPLAINNLMDSVLGLAENDYDLLKKYDFRHVKIVRDYGPDLFQVPCTATEIEQVFLNLIKNAAEAMADMKGNKAPRITITTRREKNHALVQIEDNGPGMADEIRRRVFEPFFTTKPVGVGTGLGLSVSYFIVTHNHRGTLSVESRPGEGTRFMVRLPLEIKGHSEPENKGASK